MPIIIPIIPFIGGRRRRVVSSEAPPAAGPVLVAATYDQGATVDLTFDRAVDASGFELASLSLFDGPIGFQYGATDVTVLSPTAVRIGIVGVEEWTGAGVTLDVSGANGIVAVDGGAAWAGVTGVGLPFP